MMNFCCIKNYTHKQTNILKTKTVTYGNGSYKMQFGLLRMVN